MIVMTKTTGTREWADSNVNCVTGCAHDCVYCYARKMAIRFKHATPETWKNMVVRRHDVNKQYGKRQGRIMFPTSHDLVPSDPSFYSCMQVLTKLLAAGNDVLITTKPCMETVSFIRSSFKDVREQIQFRFTITSMDDSVLARWEPNAPRFKERLHAMQMATYYKFATSVSIEPVLDSSIEAVRALVNKLLPWCTGSIWIGVMNHVRDPPPLTAAELYQEFVGTPRIRFKDSIRNALK